MVIVGNISGVDCLEIHQMPKKVLIALPLSMLEAIDFTAQVEHRNRSDLIREALRRYLDSFRRDHRITEPVISGFPQ